MDKSINIEILSRYRTSLMGFAAIMILCCHAEPNGVAMPGPISWLLQWGNYGVDIFLLLSGFGLYFSLRKASSLALWYKKRYARILVPYLLISCGYYVYYCIVNNLNVVDYLLLISTISYWTDHIGAWFIALLIPLYAITPIYDKIFERINHNGLFTIVCVILLLVITSIKTNNAVALNVEFALSRVPAFLLGYYLGQLIYIKKNVKVIYLILIFVGSIMTYVLCKYMCPDVNRAILLVLPMIFLAIPIAKISNVVCGWLLPMFGRISLESYLFNIYLGYILSTSFHSYANLVGYIVIVVLGTLLSLVVNKISEVVMNKILIRH